MSTLRDTSAPPLDEWPPQACKGADPRWFFPTKSGDQSMLERHAKAVCGGCAAVKECLAYALPIVDLAGVWGAMNANERTRARKKRKEA